VKRSFTKLRQGTMINENEISEKLWTTVKKKFNKIDNFKNCHSIPDFSNVPQGDTAIEFLTNEFENLRDSEIEVEIEDVSEEVDEIEIEVLDNDIDLIHGKYKRNQKFNVISNFN
jgi:hypothetical protein